VFCSIVISVINNILLNRSGGLIVIFPPLMPEAEKIILKSTSGEILKNHKNEMKHWAAAKNIKFIDASMSEKYGCAPEDFYNPHHALDLCFSKILFIVISSRYRVIASSNFSLKEIHFRFFGLTGSYFKMGNLPK